MTPKKETKTKAKITEIKVTNTERVNYEMAVKLNSLTIKQFNEIIKNKTKR